MRKLISWFFLLILAACNRPTPIPPPPIPGPAVLGDGVLIANWEYFGPNAVERLPELSANVKEVGNDVYEVRLVQKERGFDLVWSQLPCATQPVIIIHDNASIEFWPGEGVGFCEAMSVLHMLTVEFQTTTPIEKWEFVLYPPPESDG